MRHAEAVERGARTQEEALKSRLFIVEQDRVSNEKRLAMQAFSSSLFFFSAPRNAGVFFPFSAPRNAGVFFFSFPLFCVYADVC